MTKPNPGGVRRAIVVGTLWLAALAPAVAEEGLERHVCGRAHALALALAPADSPDHRKYAPVREADILHLAIDLTPDFRQRTIAAQTTIRFRPVAVPFRQLTLDAVDLRVRNVTGSEQLQGWQNTDRQLILSFAQDIPADREVTVTVDYTAEPRQGLYFRTPEMGYPPGDTHLFTQGESITHRHWFPCFDAPNEMFTSEVTCHVPAGMTALSNGRLISETADAVRGLTTFHWLQDKPHVNYLIAVAAGHFKTLEDRYGEIPLLFHTPPSQAAFAAGTFAGTKDMMAFFEREIGVPYPWARYAQVCVQDFVAGGMENTTLTILTDGTLFPPETENLRSSQGLVAHELVHQWFGDLVTCKDWSHLWLNEGFATYYAALYDGHRDGRDAMLWTLYNDARTVLGQPNDTRPIVWRGFDSPDEQFSYLAYPKGAWVLHMLRSQLGEDLYRKCVRTYLERHTHDNAVTEDLNSVIEELSGRSFDQFFDQWVYHAHHPELDIDYSWDEKAKLARLSVRQVQALSDKVLLFNFPLPVRFHTPDGVVNRTLTVKARAEDFTVALPAAPQRVRIDPDYTVLAKIRFTPPTDMLHAQLADAGDLIGRLLAIEILSDRRDRESVAKLKQALNQDPFHAVRTEAANALRNIHSDEALEALLASTNQPDARVRRQVRQVLRGFYREPVIAGARAALATEKNPDIVVELVRTLGLSSDPATRDELLARLRSDSFRNIVADAAIAAMRAQDDPAYVAPLLEALRFRGPAFTSGDFAQALGTLAHLARNDADKTAVREFLAARTLDPRRHVAGAAIRALGTLGDPRALAVVQTFATADKDSPERRAAEEAMSRLRAARQPVDDHRALRDEVLGFQKENRELRREFEALKKKFEERAAQPSAPASDARKVEAKTE